jgi:macrolide-specific efflux system membrane fusion protein
MVFRNASALLFIWLLSGFVAAHEIKIPGALVKLIDQLDVPAREAGTIIELRVDEGSRVKAADLLARIDDADARFAENRATVELQIASQNAASDVAVRSAERALGTAESELKRAEDARLKLRDVVTETEMEKLRLAFDQAKLAVEKARQERTVSQLQRDLKKVEADFAALAVARRQAAAPFPGVVVQVYKHIGDWVQPGEKLLRVIRLDRLRVEAFLEAARVTPNLEGQPVTLVVEGVAPATFYRGKLTFVSPEIDPFNRSVRILAEIENPQLTLQPGSRGTLTIQPSNRP